MPQWRHIPGYLGLYEICPEGLVRNTFNKQIRKCAAIPSLKSPTIYLSKNNVTTAFRVDRLVTEIFVPNPFNYKYIVNLTSNKDNLHKDNYIWVENFYQWDPLPYKLVSAMATKYLLTDHSINELAIENGISHRQASKVIANYCKANNLVQLYDAKVYNKRAATMRVKQLTTCKPVEQLTLEGKFIKRFPSISKAARELNIPSSSISDSLKSDRRHKTAGGFKWRLPLQEKSLNQEPSQ